MSAVHPSPSSAHGVRSEEDQVPVVRILLVGLGALLVFFLGSVAAVGYLRARQQERGPIAIPEEVGESKIGLVEQQIFDLAVRGERAQEKKRERLGSTGWVDKKAGVAHIPIAEAMRLVARGVRSAIPAGGESTSGGQP